LWRICGHASFSPEWYRYYKIRAVREIESHSPYFCAIFFFL
jgi:hypothetical protein